MAIATNVTPDVIAVYMGREAPDSGSTDFLQWEMFIADAVWLIESRRVELGAAVEDVPQQALDYVVRQAVKSHLSNPDDVTNVSVSVDDGSLSKSYSSGPGRVAIRDEWWKSLGLSGKSDKAYAVDTAPGSVGGSHSPWCSVAWGANCSCGAYLAGYPIFGVP